MQIKSPIIEFKNEIFVNRSKENNPFSNQFYYARLLGYNTETRNFIFDFHTPVRIKDISFYQGEAEVPHVIHALDFQLIGHYKDDLVGLLRDIKEVGAIHKIESIPREVAMQVFKEERQQEAEQLVSFMKTLLEINTGERVVETEVIEDCDSNNDPEEGNYVANLNGELVIKDEELSDLACQVLVGPNGQVNRFAMGTLKEGGFNVFPTEKDSFGWLGGAVRTNKGLIFFG